MSDQQTDRLEEIKDRGSSFGGGPDRSEWEWLLRVVEEADELVKTYKKADYKEASVDAALAKYQEARRG